VDVQLGFLVLLKERLSALAELPAEHQPAYLRTAYWNSFNFLGILSKNQICSFSSVEKLGKGRICSDEQGKMGSSTII
jgi:hypothetical protein